MKISLEEEAENYAHNYFDMHETNNYKALKQGYIACATKSKYVEAQKIQAIIDYISNEMISVDYIIREVYINELQQQLNNI